jgi:hypothetical protein
MPRLTTASGLAIGAVVGLCNLINKVGASRERAAVVASS